MVLQMQNLCLGDMEKHMMYLIQQSSLKWRGRVLGIFMKLLVGFSVVSSHSRLLIAFIRSDGP